ncbi:hypothetical protein [Arthrobacter sp. NPDC090010]|uniref:hypothetical protein n=1 Tax=Arthrobacter sp. NPDC090010 TaxID=3363942 RepID=UPI0038096939
MRLLTTRIMLGALVACALLLVQAALAPEALGFALLLICAAVALVCAIASVAILRRNKTLLAAGVFSVLATTLIVAFIRVWGLGSGTGYNVMHTSGFGARSDNLLFAGLLCAGVALLILLLGSIWPTAKPGPRSGARRPVRRGAPRKPSGSRPVHQARPRASRSRAH